MWFWVGFFFLLFFFGEWQIQPQVGITVISEDPPRRLALAAGGICTEKMGTTGMALGENRFIPGRYHARGCLL